LKLLFDQNISSKIVPLVQSNFPGAQQVVQVGLENASDLAIFEFAKTNQFIIVTFDSDFVDLSLVRGTPPKIIWLRTGNLTTKSISELLDNNANNILHFIESEEARILEIIRFDK
jgi:predicted nuclease of predicted toxin-antitoxin system